MDNTDYNKLLYKAISLSLMLVFLILAFNAFWAFEESSKLEQSRAGESLPSTIAIQSEINASGSMLISARKKRKQTLSVKVGELSAPLTFMVWPYERKRLSQDIVSLIHQQINISPFDASLWRQLSFVEADAKIRVNERAWTLLNGLSLSNWNTSERILLTRHCVAEYESFNKVMAEQCRALINQLPMSLTIRGLSEKMGVKIAYLKWLLLTTQAQESIDLKHENNVEQSQ